MKLSRWKPMVYRRSFAAGTPYLDITVDNLRRLHPAVLDQATGREAPDWERAVALVVERVAGTGVEWLLIGGAALAVQGVEVTPADVEVITDVDGAKKMNDLFADCLTTPAAEVPGWGYFGRAFHGARIEWAGNEPNQNPGMWKLSESHRVVTWRGHQVRVALLETYLEIERGRERTDRVAAIEAVLSAGSTAGSATLDAELGENLTLVQAPVVLYCAARLRRSQGAPGWLAVWGSMRRCQVSSLRTAS